MPALIWQLLSAYEFDEMWPSVQPPRAARVASQQIRTAIRATIAPLAPQGGRRTPLLCPAQQRAAGQRAGQPRLPRGATLIADCIFLSVQVSDCWVCGMRIRVLCLHASDRALDLIAL
jgi:hypothetical protein